MRGEGKSGRGGGGRRGGIKARSGGAGARLNPLRRVAWDCCIEADDKRRVFEDEDGDAIIEVTCQVFDKK